MTVCWLGGSLPGVERSVPTCVRTGGCRALVRALISQLDVALLFGMGHDSANLASTNTDLHVMLLNMLAVAASFQTFFSNYTTHQR